MQNAQTKQINVKTIWITPEITTTNHKKKENQCGLKPHSDVNYSNTLHPSVIFCHR